MYTSAFKRAILSLKNVRKTYGQDDIPCYILTQIGECGGIQSGGLKKSEALELLPGLQISEKSKPIDEEGWWSIGHKEKLREMIVRSKENLEIFKEMAKEDEMKEKTVFTVCHGAMMHLFAVNILLPQDLKELNFAKQLMFVPANNALTIIDFDVIEEEEEKKRVEVRLVGHNI